MFDLFRNNKNDDRHESEGPKIVFANLRRRSRPILSKEGYKTFSVTTSLTWGFIVFFIWIFRVEVLLSPDIIVSLPSSSVELAALSLAVLGILHEINKEDKWFKLGLFLVAVFFSSVVLGGFFLSVTWKPEYDLPQQITIVLVALLGIGATTQINWRRVVRFMRLQWLVTVNFPVKLKIAIKQTRTFFPFVFPFLIVWFPGLNRLTTVFIVFIGALVTLITLMGVTTISFFRSPLEPEPEDPFITTLRTRYETEIKAIIRFGELKILIVDALNYLQKIHIQTALIESKPPTLIEKASLVIRLRQMNITDDEEIINAVVHSLVNDGVICKEGYSGPYWLVPGKESIDKSVDSLKELTFIQTQKDDDPKSQHYKLAGHRFENLRGWLAIKVKLPEFVVGEYIMPKVLEWLYNPEKYHVVTAKGHNTDYYSNYRVERTLFVSRIWEVPENSNFLIEEIEARLSSYINSSYTRENRKRQEEFLQALPHSIDGFFSSLGEFSFRQMISLLIEEINSTKQK